MKDLMRMHYVFAGGFAVFAFERLADGRFLMAAALAAAAFACARFGAAYEKG